jgi:hypothetical protein
MKTTVEANLLNALAELQDAVKLMPDANPKPNLLPLFSRIDELAGELPPTANPELRHFLERKSYEKARLLLQGRGKENVRGGCGH